MGRPNTSKVHSYYKFDCNLKESSCKHCTAKIKGNHSTNLRKHLASHHNEQYEELLVNESKINKKTNGVSKIIAHQRLFNLNESKHVKVSINEKTIIDACVDLVTINGRPFSMLNDTGFRRILDPVLNGFQKKFKINSNIIKKHVHEESLLIQQEIITEASSKLISLKLDAVTRLNRSFLGVNMQYIVENSIKLKTLGLIELTESHTGIYLKQTILNILKKFKIDPKQLYTITSDNGANMLKAINLVEKDVSTTLQTELLDESDTVNDDVILNDTNETHSNISSDDECSDSETGADCSILDEEQIGNLLNEDIECVDSTYQQTELILNEIELQSFGDCSIFTGIRCVAHTLQLAVIDSLKDSIVEKLLNKVRILVRKLRNQTYIYLIKKEKLKLPILDCLTRWHSTYDMIERIQYLKEFIQIMVANDPKLKKISLNNFDWQQIEILAKTLLPAKICTKKLQNEQLTLSDFYSSWISCKIETRSLGNPFSNKLVKCMENREQFIMNNKVLLAAVFLDPRFKITLDEIQYNMAINHLVSVWLYLKNNGMGIKDTDENVENMEDRNSESDLDSNENSDVLEQFLREKESVEPEISCSSQYSTSKFIENKLKTYYLNQKRLSLKTNILQFWQSMEDMHPELCVLAKIVFAVPSTQVSVERLFSGLKFILSPYRSNITSKHLEDQLIVRTNRLFEKKNLTKV